MEFVYIFLFFFFNDTATTEIYTLSLHDALPIYLAVLVQEIIREIGSNNECLDLFNEKLASYGYNPAEADSYIKQLRIVAERLFIVNDDFPRLTADSFQPSLPPGIGEVQYTLEKIGRASCRERV